MSFSALFCFPACYQEAHAYQLMELSSRWDCTHDPSRIRALSRESSTVLRPKCDAYLGYCLFLFV